MAVDSAGHALRDRKVLIIDDDEVIRMALRGIFKKENCGVVEAGNGNAGVSLFRQEKPDIVITDILMPDKEGLETISEIRACDPHVKIIAMSGGGSVRDMGFLKLAGKLGANGTLHKPFRPDEILSLIGRLL